MRKINCPKACGECCKVIILTNNVFSKTLQEQWKERKTKEGNWMLKNLIEISHLKAIRINPIFKGTKSLDRDRHYFTCKGYDYESNKCTLYKKWRPWMCTGYPMYDNPVLDATHFWNVPNCYYINQLMKA